MSSNVDTSEKMLRRWTMCLCLVGGTGLFLGVATGGSLFAGQVARQPLPVAEVLTAYDRGSYETFFSTLGGSAADRDLFPNFKREAERWLDAAAVEARPRRAIVAASVALEVAHLLRDDPPDHAGRYLLWASELMRKEVTGVPTPVERAWHLAALAGMQELDEPFGLTTGAGTPQTEFGRMVRTIGSGGQAAIAIGRFPDEPKFRLAPVAALAWNTREDSVPSYLEFVQREVAARPGVRPARGGRSGLLDQPATSLARFRRLPEVIAAYKELAVHAELRAEVALQVGFLESLAQNWTTALGHLRRVPELTDEAYLKYLSHYLIGNVLRYSGDPDGAVEAFERALEIVPDARSAATQLAAELILSDRLGARERAFGLLQAAYSDGAPEDPWRLIRHGDARLWASYMARLREALQ